MKIIIKNISRKVTADSLSAIFSTYGQVNAASMLAFTGNHENDKTAFIFMPDEREAGNAIEQLNGCVVDGQALLVKAEEKRTKSILSSYYFQVRGYLTPAKKKYSFITKD